MQWIQDHAKDLATILSGIYLAIRGIVWLTPTPRDDAALEKFNPVLKAGAKLFGLDLKVGIEQKPEPEKQA